VKPPLDPRIRIVTDLWSAAFKARYGRKYAWDLGLHGKQSEDRKAALRVIAVARIPLPEHDGVEALSRTRDAMEAYLDAHERYVLDGLVPPEAQPTLARFGRDVQRWLGSGSPSPSTYSNPLIPVIR